MCPEPEGLLNVCMYCTEYIPLFMDDRSAISMESVKAPVEDLDHRLGGHAPQMRALTNGSIWYCDGIKAEPRSRHGVTIDHAEASDLRCQLDGAEFYQECLISQLRNAFKRGSFICIWTSNLKRLHTVFPLRFGLTILILFWPGLCY